MSISIRELEVAGSRPARDTLTLWPNRIRRETSRAKRRFTRCDLEIAGSNPARVFLHLSPDKGDATRSGGREVLSHLRHGSHVALRWRNDRHGCNPGRRLEADKITIKIT
jgi:hypothetical protein